MFIQLGDDGEDITERCCLESDMIRDKLVVRGHETS